MNIIDQIFGSDTGKTINDWIDVFTGGETTHSGTSQSSSGAKSPSGNTGIVTPTFNASTTSYALPILIGLGFLLLK